MKILGLIVLIIGIITLLINICLKFPYPAYSFSLTLILMGIIAIKFG